MDPIRSAAQTPQHNLPPASIAGTESSRSSLESFRTAPVNTPQEQRRQDIRDLLNDIFAPYKLRAAEGDDVDPARIREQHQKIDRLIDSRSEKLLEANQTAADIRRVLEKAKTLDLASVNACAFANGLPFAATLILQYLKPEVLAMFGNSTGGQWAGSALQACIADRFMAPTLESLTADTQYLKPPTDKLHDSMQDSIKEKEPKTMQKTLEEGALWQSYLPRNLLRTAVVPAVASQNPQLATTLDGLGTPVTGILAGLITAMVRMQMQEGRDLIGPALLFGRKDAEERDEFEEQEWLQNYQAIDTASYSSQALNGLSRLVDLPKNFLADLISGKSARSLAEPESLYSSIALTGSFSAVGEAQAAAVRSAQEKGAGPGIAELARLGTITTLSIPAFAIYGMGYAGGKAGAESTENWLRQDHQVADKAKALAQGASTSISSTVNSLNSAVDSLRRRQRAPNDDQDIEMQDMRTTGR